MSAIILGVMVGWEARPPLWVAAVVVGFFADFSWSRSRRRTPPATDALLYSIGFVVATGCLHAAGIGIGLIHRWKAGKVTMRLGGVGVAITGCVFLWSALT